MKPDGYRWQGGPLITITVRCEHCAHFTADGHPRSIDGICNLDDMYAVAKRGVCSMFRMCYGVEQLRKQALREDAA